jgi:hypothetical protein
VKLATPIDLLGLSRGLSLRVEQNVAHHVALSSGEGQIHYEEKHVGVPDGEAVTRRDRAAMQLALEVIRASHAPAQALDDVHAVLYFGGTAARRLRGWLVEAQLERRRRREQRRPGGWRRVMVARLALYLRAVLRADVGDFGPCTHFAGFHGNGRTLSHTHRPSADSMRGWCFGKRCYQPLWELAR